MTRRALWLAAVVLVGLAGVETLRLLRIQHWNALIAAGRVEDPGPHAPVELRFAAAYASAARGDVEAALNGYRELETTAGGRIRSDAQFNSGNLYLQSSLAPRAGTDSSAALTLVELAKQSYRDVLRRDSADWDARYNLERALRLAPDPDADSAAMSTPPTRLRTATTGRGSSLGLP